MKRQRTYTNPQRSTFQMKRRKVARPPAATKAQIKKVLLNLSDTKNYDVQYTDTAPNTGMSAPSHLTAVPQGDGASERIGANISVVGLQWSYVWTIADTTNVVRCIVLQCKGTEVPTHNEVVAFASVGSGFVGNVSYHNQKRLFNILFDSGPVCLSADTPQVSGNIKIHKMMEIEYNNTGTINEKGAIYVYAWSDSVAASHPELRHNSTLYYKDL